MHSLEHRCSVCVDGEGFIARPCRCGRQKPLDAYHARIYQLPVGSYVPPRPLDALDRARAEVAAMAEPGR